VPFVQGHLRGEPLSCIIETECGHCHLPIRIELDSNLTYRVPMPEAEPLVYMPLVNLAKLEESNIINRF
jgi:hypothetical protein